MELKWSQMGKAVILNLSIKRVPEDVVERLRERARLNHRSLQGELMSILEESVRPSTLNANDLREYVVRLGLQTDDDGTEMVREDRDAR